MHLQNNNDSIYFGITGSIVQPSPANTSLLKDSQSLTGSIAQADKSMRSDKGDPYADL